MKINIVLLQIDITVQPRNMQRCRMFHIRTAMLLCPVRGPHAVQSKVL